MRRYGLTLGFFSVDEAIATTIYQVTITSDGRVRHDLPMPAGASVAHRRLHQKLVRVRFEPLANGAPQSTKEERGQRMRQILHDGVTVCDKYFCVHFAHKDADKGQKDGKSQLWFARVQACYRETPAKCIALYRSVLLDYLSHADGRKAGKSLSIAKLNARLCLAFSSTASVPECAPTVAAVIDLRGQHEALTSQQLAQQLPPLPAGQVQMVIVDDIRGRREDGSPTEKLMTDGAGCISLDVAARIPACTSGRRLDRGGGHAGAPLLSQVRVWHRGYVAKGILMADSQLPAGYIVLRASMVKVYGRPRNYLNLSEDEIVSKPKAVQTLFGERSAFEVIRTSNGGARASLPPRPMTAHCCRPLPCHADAHSSHALSTSPHVRARAPGSYSHSRQWQDEPAARAAARVQRRPSRQPGTAPDEIASALAATGL